ncbi:hypothetical protein KR093_007985, partial [Drosophila rubida]
YFGGLAGAMAAAMTHPLDLLKVASQTHQGKLSIIDLIFTILREQGIRSFYKGISASILRQLTYSTSRFGCYEVGKDFIDTSEFAGKVWLAALSGFIGGTVGSPADMVNVRMQNDVKLPIENRRNYKHAIDGLWKAYRQDGVRSLFNGGATAAVRGSLMNVGQIAFYDQYKSYMLRTSHFKDNSITHFLASLLAGATATTITQPMDVLKTRIMNARPGDFNGIMDVIKYTAQLGPTGFFKGYVPAFLRISPHTILTFMFLEQLRLHFG